MVVPLHQNGGKSHHLLIYNNSFEDVARLNIWK
jgi:hypothetical protein